MRSVILAMMLVTGAAAFTPSAGDGPEAPSPDVDPPTDALPDCSLAALQSKPETPDPGCEGALPECGVAALYKGPQAPRLNCEPVTSIQKTDPLLGKGEAKLADEDCKLGCLPKCVADHQAPVEVLVEQNSRSARIAWVDVCSPSGRDRVDFAEEQCQIGAQITCHRFGTTFIWNKDGSFTLERASVIVLDGELERVDEKTVKDRLYVLA